jgi:CheY-like chemotaxis protein
MSTRKHLPKLLFVCLIAVACVDPGLSQAQNNVRDRVAGTNPAVEKSPLTDLWMGYSTQGNPELAESIAALSRLKQWPQVNVLLSRVAGSGASKEVLSGMAQTIGSRNFLAIKGEPSLSEAGSAGLEMLTTALRATAEAPARLRQAIAELDSRTSDKSLAATRTLLSGGEAAIIELVAAAIKKPTPENRDQLLRTMLQLGTGGMEGLQQLALYGTDEVRAPALECLARIDRSRHTMAFLTAALAADSTPEERNVGETNLMLLGRDVPTPAAGRERLLSNFKKSEHEAELTKNDDSRTTLWSVNDSRTGITHQPTRELLAVYRGVADAASRLRRVGGLTLNDASDILAAEIGYRLMIDPDWGDPKQIQNAKQEYPILSDATALLNALDHAMQTNDLPAAVGLLRVIDTTNATDKDKQVYLRGTGINRTALVRAASSPEPRIRYEAALKVNDLAKGSAFPGSSFVMRTLSEMNSLTNKPTAILVETRADTTMQAESLLSSIGFKVEVVGSVAALQRAIRRGGDLRMVLAKTQLSDLPPIEMVDNVRRLDRGKQVPIVFYGASGPDLSSRRWRAPTLWINQPNSIAALENLRREVKQSRRIPQMTFLDRQTYKTLAAQALATQALAAQALAERG